MTMISNFINWGLTVSLAMGAFIFGIWILSSLKKNIPIIVLSIVLYSVNFVLAEEFAIKSDQSVRVLDQVFSSKQEYIQSDYFRENGKRCGTRELQGITRAPEEKSVAHCTKYLTSIQTEYWPSVVYEIPVWWHVIHTSSGFGNISDAAINAQMHVLNEDFRAEIGTIGVNGNDVKVQFVLAGIERVQNGAWFSDSEADEESYKKALAKDPNTYMNIYTNDASGYLGYTYFPQDSAGQWRDGIVLDYGSVGGRDNSYYPYDQGRTLVHEMGHYLGLYHTFENGCSNSYSSGDLIVDTNAEESPNFDGSVPVTSCGTADPVHNYMNFVEDSYMWEFTQEQANRAVCSLVNYRPELYAIIDTPSWRLSFSKSGSGQGSVSSIPTGISCNENCSNSFAYFAPNTPVTLIATAQGNTSFSGWSGACSGVNDCQIFMDQAKYVTANFTDDFPWETFLPAFTTNSKPELTCKYIEGCYDGFFTDNCDGIPFTGRILVKVNSDCSFSTSTNIGVGSQGNITSKIGTTYKGTGRTDINGCGNYNISCTGSGQSLDCNYIYTSGSSGSVYNSNKTLCK